MSNTDFLKAIFCLPFFFFKSSWVHVGWFQGEFSSQYQSEPAVQKQIQVRSKHNLLLYVLHRNHLKRVNLLPDHTYCIPNVQANHAHLALRFLFSTITKSFSNIYKYKSEACGRKSESAWKLIIVRAIIYSFHNI